MAHVVEDALNDAGAFGARQAKAIVDDIRQIGAGQRACVKTIVRSSDTRVGHNILHPFVATSAPPRSRRYAIANTPNRQLDFWQVFQSDQ
jgi:hypothetical protein